MQMTELVRPPVGNLTDKKRPGKTTRTSFILVILVGLTLGLSAFGDAPAQAAPLSTGDGSWAWSNPLPEGNDLLAVSCPSATFCAAVGTRGSIIMYDGVSWTSGPPLLTNLTDNYYGVSCPTTTYCVAVSGLGTIAKYSGGSWSLYPSSNQFRGVSCLGVDNCLLVALGSNNNNRIFVFNGSGALTVIALNENGAVSYSLFSVSCASASFCIAAGSKGYYYTYQGNPAATLTIGQLSGFDPGFQNPVSVSCTAAGGTPNCVMAGFGGHWSQYTSGNWSATATVPSMNFNTVFCSSATNCLGGGDNGSAARLLTFNGTSWSGSAYIGSPAIPIYTEIFGISCASASYCLGVGNSGLVQKYNGSSWNAFPIVPVEVTANLNGVSCPTTTLAAIKCATVGSLNNNTYIATYDGLNWSKPNFQVLSNQALNGVSCSDALTCIAVGSGGTIFADTNGSWSNVASVVTGAPNLNLNGVSCLNSINSNGLFCMIVGNNGTILKYSGGTWTNLQPLSNISLFGVYCVDITLCFAVGDSATVLQYDGSSWTAATTNFLGNNPNFRSISCSSSTSCRAGGQYTGQKFIAALNGTSWTLENQLGTYTGSWNGMACPVDKICFAVGDPNTTGNTNRTNISTLGSSWSPTNSGTSAKLNGVSCAGPLYCVAVGVNGTILISQLVVRVGNDTGTGNFIDTLSYALRYAQAGQTITFRLPSGTNNTVQFTGPLNPMFSLKAGVGLDGGDCNTTGLVIIDGASQTGNGLTLNGGNNIRHLKVHGFSGQQIVARTTPSFGQANHLQCTISSKV